MSDEKQTLWIVLRDGKVIPGIVATTHRDALQQLGRWLTPYDIAFSGSVLYDIGREATSDGNPFTCESIVVKIGDTSSNP